MSDKIVEAYPFSPLENELITNNFSIHTDWSDAKYDTIKVNIKEHLVSQQERQCCYCKRTLRLDKRCIDIEHIIPKSKMDKFTFLSLNLSLSCPACNSIKHYKDVLSIEYDDVEEYPNPEIFTIVHPHLDYYSLHINIINGCIYESKNSSKGEATIKMCGLDRLKVIEDIVKSEMKSTWHYVAYMVSEFGVEKYEKLGEENSGLNLNLLTIDEIENHSIEDIRTMIASRS